MATETSRGKANAEIQVLHATAAMPFTSESSVRMMQRQSNARVRLGRADLNPGSHIRCGRNEQHNLKPQTLALTLGVVVTSKIISL